MAETERAQKRKEIDILRTTLESERSSYISHWRDIGEYILPRRPTFTLSDTNRGERRNTKIVDSTATMAARTLRAGMTGGVTSPARPWFRLTTPDPDLSEFGAVKMWLHTVHQRMMTVFLRSNLYNALPIIYGDIGTFSTAALGIEEDFTGDVLRCYPFSIGTYMLSNNDKLQVDVFIREFRLTVRQLVEKFGKYKDSGSPDWSNFSNSIKSLYDSGQNEQWIEVCHVIRPNKDYKAKSIDSKPYESIYYEKGAGYADSDKFLRESGYDYFPVLCPRWEVTGEDVYGTECPGMTALGDVKGLQVLQKRKAQAIDKMVNPPLIGPAALRTQKVSLLPGDITYYDERETMKGLRPLHEVNPQIQGVMEDIREHQYRIRRAFYEDLFLMLATTDRREITAREIDERHEEKLLALGPVLEQLNQDLLDPLIDITFDIMLRQGMIPPAPKELQGVPLKVEYISIMHQAQKLAGLSGIERFAGFTGQVAAFKPDVLDKVDADQMVDEYANIVGVPPRIVVPDDVVAQIRAVRAQAMQAQQQASAMEQGAKTAKDLSGAKLDEKSALTELLRIAQAGQVA